MKAPSEKHLEDWIVSNWEKFATFDEPTPNENGELVSWGLKFSEQLLKRQVRLNYGVADLIAVNRVGIDVIELKREFITYETLCQCMRYVTDINAIWCHASFSWTEKTGRQYPHWFVNTIDKQEIRGLVVGYDYKDENVLVAAEAMGITVALYDYDGETNSYKFQYAEMSKYPDGDLIEEYAMGVIGMAIENCISWREEILNKPRKKYWFEV